MSRNTHFPTARLLTALIALFFLLGPAQAVRADSAPPPPPEGANLFPDGEVTEVRMEAETVDIQVDDSTAYPDGQARVNAEFHMRNLGEKDEAMQVRFPLSTFYIGNTPKSLECYSAGYPIIQDFSAWVDGKAVSITKTEESVTNFGPGGGTTKIPCWANFPAVFPVGKEVVLKVSYTFPPYSVDNNSGYVEYNYILRTGAGWKGTIGSADISLRMPYAINDQNVFLENIRGIASLSQGTVSGDTIRWQLKDFEPSDGPDVSVTVTRPSLWRAILKETANTQKNPQDGEAWGRLGKAYKKAIWERRGFRDGSAAAEMFGLSAAAYQKSLALEPKDADWHAGYAELLCWDAAFPYMHSPEETRDNLVGCLNQVQLALEINPKQAQANEMLSELSLGLGSRDGTPVVSLNQGTPVYRALTATPLVPTSEVTQTPTGAAAPSATAATQPLPTGTSTPTPEAVAQTTQAATVETTNTPPTGGVAPTGDAAPTATPFKGRPNMCYSALLPAAAAMIMVGRRRNKS